jgi:hypothetical protein
MQDLASSMLYEEQAVEQLEGDGRHGEKVEGYDHLPVIPKKRKPSFAWVTTAANASKIPGDSPLGDGEAELQHLAVNLGRAPIGISSAMRRISTRISSLIFGRPLRGRSANASRV